MARVLISLTSKPKAYLMKNYIALSLLVLSSILYASCDPCTRRVSCPAFDGTFLFGWFPYGEQNKTFYFSDGIDTDTLIIDQITQTEPHRIEYRTGYSGKEEYCEINGSIASKVDDMHPGWLPVYIRHVISGQERYGSNYATITIGQYNIEMSISDDAPYDVYNGDYTVTKFDLVEINGTTYENAFIISTEDTDKASQQGIDKLYLVKGKGILGYRTYPAQREYWLQ